MKGVKILWENVVQYYMRKLHKKDYITVFRQIYLDDATVLHTYTRGKILGISYVKSYFICVFGAIWGFAYFPMNLLVY